MTDREKSRQVAGRPRPLAPKTIRNFHITLSAFFTWANREFEIASPMKAIPVPKYEEPPVEPFTKEQIEALLKACESCKEAQPIDRRKFTMRRATGKRDQAVILTLLDTGLRASELSALTIGDVDLKSGRVSQALAMRTKTEQEIRPQHGTKRPVLLIRAQITQLSAIFLCHLRIKNAWFSRHFRAGGQDPEYR